ncbi:membrane bound O-acyl transferase family-domain-containing protein [Hypoxylon rubiginosum]|uniref:Membrane bound O-acyl transferase family-domain-containing protein n=1 Tax=Hypoxylon rubiginosum TaxID=110542 RepID=A0ACC0CWM0_9PEZI|nr:membrane bound O-acyl transferase family-domain-containing protein [Hypoxylon rubiginosum]
MSSLSAVKILELIALYSSAVALIFTGLYIPERHRNALLLPIWGLLAVSIQGIDRLNFIPGLSYQFGMLVIITFLCSPLIFHARKDPIKVERRPDGRLNWNLTTAYKIFNNPRLLPARDTKAPQGSDTTRVTHAKFTIHRLLKIFLLVALNMGLNFATVPIFSKCTLDDFSPSREPIIRRLVNGTVSSHDLIIRAFISTIWIFDSISQLEISHALTSILFVVIIRADQPYEWPPLFGSTLEAYSLRRFWGRFWHRLFASAGVWAQVLTDSASFARVPAGLKKAFVAFFIFTVSGLAHAIVEWKTGGSALDRDILFFWCNYVAVCLEVVLARGWPSVLKPSYILLRIGVSPRGVRILNTVLGFLWVWAFFIWVTPRLVYPKIYGLLLSTISKPAYV